MTNGKRFNRVHAICSRLRGKPCAQCPAWEKDDQYGKVQRGCYGLAAEAVNIAVHGNPWGRSAKPKNVRRWRKRFNRE